MYPLVRRLLFLIPPEHAHKLVFAVLRGVAAVAPVRRLLRRLLGPTDPVLASTVFGVRFPAPLGLAAGFDKDGTALSSWGAMGFGYAEIGTVTAHPQPGNPAPRLFRLADDRALLNRMGFNNHGARALAIRLARHRPEIPIGVNIGKTKKTPAGDAVNDYRASARMVGPLASYLVVNVSSPNTPGLRDLQAVESLRPILSAVRAETSTPVLVKIAPDLSDSDLDDIADLAVELDLAGIVATNTTVSRDGLTTPGVDRLGPGGISGPPLAQRAVQVLRRLYDRVGDRLALISVGGIETATTRGSASQRAHRCYRAIPASSTAGNGGPRTSMKALPAGCMTAGSARCTKRSARQDVGNPAKALTLLVGAEDDRSCNRVLEKVESQICRTRVLGEVELFDLHRVYRDVVAMHPMTGRRAAPTYRRIPASLTNVSAPPGSSQPSPTPSGNSVTLAGRLATAQCQNPDRVGASGS